MNELKNYFWKLRELPALLKTHPLPVCREVDLDQEITGVATDSRTIVAGELFVALSGENFDGHDFIETAIAKGALAVVVVGAVAGLADLAQRYPQTFFLPVPDALAALANLARARLQKIDPIVVAVTGSNGKTTTKEMLAEILVPHFRVHKTAGNFNNRIGLPLTIFAMADDCQVVVLEMGMNAPGEIAALAATAPPDYVIITNIAKAHLQGLGSLDEIAKAKCEVIGELKPGASVIYSSDDPYLARLVPDTAASRPEGLVPKLISVSWHGAAEAKIKVSEIWLTPEGSSFVFTQGSEKATVKLPCWGRHNVMNAALAMAVGICLVGVAPVPAANALINFKMPSGRLEKYEFGSAGVLLHDAYNANPDSMAAALTVVAERRGKRFLALVLGDMNELGTESAVLHQQLGEKIAELRPNLLVLLGDYVGGIANAAQSGGLPFERIAQFQVGAFAAVVTLLKERLPDDALILVKGSRGVALEKVVNPLVTHFEARK
ncbi:UDP-N-acetylmuramoyl-tripeptide--D-alanyl-D-alanine ligase [bacterium]|nr:UDP-N-acetylmuramoyl-tripeptide--D-alanyl-D-alanine ligase [bacterium]